MGRVPKAAVYAAALLVAKNGYGGPLLDVGRSLDEVDTVDHRPEVTATFKPAKYASVKPEGGSIVAIETMTMTVIRVRKDPLSFRLWNEFTGEVTPYIGVGDACTESFSSLKRGNTVRATIEYYDGDDDGLVGVVGALTCGD